MATMRHINTTAMAEERKKKKEIWAIWEASIEKEYESYDPSTYESKLQKKCIYQWPNDLTLTSSMSIHRTPYMVSLGPYHHGENYLQPMEHHKQRALYRILHRSRVSLYSFIESLEGIEQELRDCYDNLDPNLPSDSFIRMMLLDGCFILELLCSSYLNENGSDNYEPIFSREGKLRSTVAFQDMLLLENQIPLLVLRKLVEVGKLNSINSDAYLNQLISSFYRFNFNQIDGSNLHILDIYRKCLIKRITTEQERTPSEEGFIKSVCMRCQPWLHAIGNRIKQIPIMVFRLLGKQISKPGNVRSAMRFHEAGVEFKKAEDPNSGLEITFDKDHGELTLPFIEIDDNTAAIYMNLMAFERMHRFHFDKRPTPEYRFASVPLFRERGILRSDEVTSYIVFMDSLIDTAEDVSLLCSRGVAKNHLGSDKDAANVFNKLGDGITYTPNEERYKDLQDYVGSDWNAARAYLKRNYFQNPWSILSLLAAIALLVLTFIQTLFSVLAVTKGN